MALTAPLRVLLFRHPDDTDAAPFEEAIVRAFQGGKETSGYLATGEDLGIQLESFSAVPSDAAGRMLDAFCHTLTIVLVDRALIETLDPEFWDWLGQCWIHTSQSNGRHAMIAVPMDERLGDRFSGQRPELASLQVRAVQEFGERAIRPAMLALLALHESRLLLARAVPPAPDVGEPRGFLRLFISHAKIDGLPLAHALRHQIKSVGWLSTYYDAEDLPPGADWHRELERGVGASLIVMLRTEVYDSRYWCQKEVRWSDEYATPAVLVDARTAMSHPAGLLPFDRVPTVRIADGNLMRVLFLALREGLRFLHFRRLVEAMKIAGALPTPVELRVFSFAPSMSALLRACRSLAALEVSAVPQLILYPDPPLGAGTYEAAQALVATTAPAAQLATPNTLIVINKGINR